MFFKSEGLIFLTQVFFISAVGVFCFWVCKLPAFEVTLLFAKLSCARRLWVKEAEQPAPGLHLDVLSQWVQANVGGHFLDFQRFM